MPCGACTKRSERLKKNKKKKSNKKKRVAALACAVLIGLGCCSFNVLDSFKPPSSGAGGFYFPSMNDEFSGMSENLDSHHWEPYEVY